MALMSCSAGLARGPDCVVVFSGYFFWEIPQFDALPIFARPIQVPLARYQQQSNIHSFICPCAQSISLLA